MSANLCVSRRGLGHCMLFSFSVIEGSITKQDSPEMSSGPLRRFLHVECPVQCKLFYPVLAP